MKEHIINMNQKEKQAENYCKLLISVTKDIRVILIKFADRLHTLT
ncbi:MAG: HD domain-containing protein [Candidatus Cloacimonetes bacterium]|nr:HD domain-containing protein [Candidatus Cloacimonadota bacterium]